MRVSTEWSTISCHCQVLARLRCNLHFNLVVHPVCIYTRHSKKSTLWAHSKHFDKPCTAQKPWPGTAGESVGAKWRKLIHSLVGVKLCYEGLNASASFDGAKEGEGVTTVVQELSRALFHKWCLKIRPELGRIAWPIWGHILRPRLEWVVSSFPNEVSRPQLNSFMKY